jgi:hypothetical protein
MLETVRPKPTDAFQPPIVTWQCEILAAVHKSSFSFITTVIRAISCYRAVSGS